MMKDPKKRGKYVPPSARVDLTRINYNSVSSPEEITFVKDGCYTDSEFTYVDCGAVEIWRAKQQKWWYEIKKGHLYSRAIRCTQCRRKKREHDRKSQANMKKRS